MTLFRLYDIFNGISSVYEEGDNMSRTSKNFEPQKVALIHTALDLFVKNGYERTTMAQIRKASNLSVGGLYHYFSSKEEILDSVIHYNLEEGVRETREKLSTIPIEKKLLFFLTDNGDDNDTSKLYLYKDENKDSLLAYKIREQNINLFIPIMIDIFRESVEVGLYKTEFPDEMAEFSMLIAKSIIETNFLPEADLVKKKKRIDAFLEILNVMLKPPAEHFEIIRSVFYSFLDIVTTEPLINHSDSMRSIFTPHFDT